jgi:hypothetical protein
VTPAVLDSPAPLFADRVSGAVSDGRVTLEERLNSVLHEARTNGSSECPLCHARVAPTSVGAECGATPAGAECTGCGSSLS